MASELFPGHRTIPSSQPGWTDFITAPELSFLRIMRFDTLPFEMKH